jgi:hypothetical protein
MTFEFDWNEFADQPHNVAPRRERFKHHLKHAGSYLCLAGANLRLAIPILSRYRRYRRTIYNTRVSLGSPFGVGVTPFPGRSDNVLRELKDSGCRQTLVRLPSWEKQNLPVYERFLEGLRREGFEVVLALLQQRQDVIDPSSWRIFLESAFDRFANLASYFEIGHAWNRTKWGVWDHGEYLRLALPAMEIARKSGLKILGPAVIDFEFHLYPPLLRVLPFDKVTSLLYVDRMGPPENKQFGWDESRKICLLKAVVEASAQNSPDVWITEVNWPLLGTGKYSPASGRPNVTEEEQADYLVRYFILALASGLVERVYWWQLVAPGYGLVDSREPGWRRRPSYLAFQTMVRLLDRSLFTGSSSFGEARLFFYSREGDSWAVCWTSGQAFEYEFPAEVVRVVSRDGKETVRPGGRIRIEGAPKYVFFG